MIPYRPRVVLASLSGETGVAWARAGASEAGAARLGGIAVDEPTREAARALVARGRSEFLPDDPVAWIDEQLTSLADDPIHPGVNVRAATPEPVRRAARVCARHGATLEVNAHCRQSEMCGAGAGERLMREPDRLAAQVRAAAATGARVSVKLRAEVTGVSLPPLARRLATAGADAIHVDAMDNEGVVACVADACDAAVIANNGVRDRRTVREYLACGADAVSLGRPSDDPVVRKRVTRAVREWFEENANESARDEAAGVGEAATDESSRAAAGSRHRESARDGGVSR